MLDWRYVRLIMVLIIETNHAVAEITFAHNIHCTLYNVVNPQGLITYHWMFMERDISGESLVQRCEKYTIILPVELRSDGFGTSWEDFSLRIYKLPSSFTVLFMQILERPLLAWCTWYKICHLSGWKILCYDCVISVSNYCNIIFYPKHKNQWNILSWSCCYFNFKLMNVFQFNILSYFAS